MANLAIRGHATRGKEVIEILMMLGGKNSLRHWGILTNRLYLINAFGDIEDISLRDSSKYHLYTLEEFLEKYPYKVGDKVIIEKYKQIFEILSVRWFTERNIIMYQTSNGWYYATELKPYKEETFGECIEKTIDICLFGEQETMEKQIKIDIPKDYKFVCIDDDNQKVVFEKVKPKYPKTYKECCEVLNLGEDGKLYTKGYKSALIQSIHQLLICRDAYWKIFGEEMGLDEPWEPDFTDTKEMYYIFYKGYIEKGNQRHPDNHILIFPTPEMRDAFYENFKDIIEFCKELL